MDKYAELGQLLFGGGADELVYKLSPEQKKRKDFERKQAQIGLASNVVGIGAGVAGLKDATANFREVRRAKPGETIKPKPIKISRGTKALAGGAVALQVANLGGDIVANRVLSRSAKKDKINKALRFNEDKLRERYNDSVRSGTAKPNGKVRGQYLQPVPKLSVKKSEPGGSDLHVPGVGTLKRKAAQKVVNETPHIQQAGIKVGRKAKDKVKAKIEKKNGVVWEGEFAKVDSDKRQVFGWASIVEVDGVPVVDLQGDYIDIEEVEKSAYDYVVKSRKGGDMHRRDGEVPVHVSDMIESFIVTPEKREKMGLPDSVPSGWWVGYQINDDEAWNLVKSGKRTGFSIHGRGQRTPDVL
jgi:hypothetical protein